MISLLCESPTFVAEKRAGADKTWTKWRAPTSFAIKTCLGLRFLLKLEEQPQGKVPHAKSVRIMSDFVRMPVSPEHVLSAF